MRNGFVRLCLLLPLLLVTLCGCENLHLGMPGNVSKQADDALAAEKAALKLLTGSNKKELKKKKDDVLAALTKAEPFLARAQNELQSTELITAQNYLKRSDQSLRRLLDARLAADDDSEINAAIAAASDSIGSAEEAINKQKSKQ